MANRPKFKPDRRREMLRALMPAQGGRCYYCRVEISDWMATFDHVVPLALGGRNWLPNIVLACLPCNNAKADMPPEDFFALLREKSERDEAMARMRIEFQQARGSPFAALACLLRTEESPAASL